MAYFDVLTIRRQRFAIHVRTFQKHVLGVHTMLDVLHRGMSFSFRGVAIDIRPAE